MFYIGHAAHGLLLQAVLVVTDRGQPANVGLNKEHTLLYGLNPGIRYSGYFEFDVTGTGSQCSRLKLRVV